VHTEDSGKNRAGNNGSVTEGHFDIEDVMNDGWKMWLIKMFLGRMSAVLPVSTAFTTTRIVITLVRFDNSLSICYFSQNLSIESWKVVVLP
jgi:hypothetical protein